MSDQEQETPLEETPADETPPAETPPADVGDPASNEVPPGGQPTGNAIESAPEDAAGPGSGVAAAGTTLTGAGQAAANDVIDGLQGLSNHVFDVGEAGLADALKIVDAAQTGISNITSILTGKITGSEVGKLPTIPTEAIGTTLTAEAQKAANRLINGLQTLTNEVYDVAEEGLQEALQVVDAAQQEVTKLYSSVTGLLTGRLKNLGS